MTAADNGMDAEGLAARLGEIDDLHARGVLNDEERAIARRAALDKAIAPDAKAAVAGAASAPEPGSKTEGPGPTSGRPRVRRPVIAGLTALVAVVVFIAVALIATRGSNTPAPAAEATPPAATTRPTGLVPYAGGTFSIGYPRGWIRETTDEDMGGYFDTTWVSRQGKDAILRVNSSPGDPADGYESALMLEQGTQSTPGYQRVSITRTRLAGMPAARWEFLTTGDSGRTLRTVNVLASDGVDGWAVLTRNPVSQDGKWRPIFREARQSFEVL